MFEKITYINHLNEAINFGENGIYINYNDLRDFSWDSNIINNRISSFTKKITQKNFPLLIISQTDSEGIQIKTRLFEVLEKDVLATSPGRLYINDYYLRCYAVQSKKSIHLYTQQLAKISLTLITDFPYWIRETQRTFMANDEGVPGSDFLDFPHDFPYDYGTLHNNHTLSNSGIASNNFKLIIYGPCNNPQIYIADHLYQVAAEIAQNEHLIIDSIEKTVTLFKNNAQTVNYFHLRNRESYIFEKIPPGDNAVTWSGDFGFDITLYEERSEPQWT